MDLMASGRPPERDTKPSAEMTFPQKAEVQIQNLRELLLVNAPRHQLEDTVTSMLDRIQDEDELRFVLDAFFRLLDQSVGWQHLYASTAVLKAATRIRFLVRDQLRVQDLAARALILRLDQLLLLPSPEVLSDWSSSLTIVVSHGLTWTQLNTPALDLLLSVFAARAFMKNTYLTQFLGYLIKSSRRCTAIREDCVRTLTTCARLLLQSMPQLPPCRCNLEAKAEELRLSYQYCCLDFAGVALEVKVEHGNLLEGAVGHQMCPVLDVNHLDLEQSVKTREVFSLKHACRLKVREFLWENWSLPEGIRKLDIPRELVEYLLLN